MKEISMSHKVKVIKLFLGGETYDEITEQVGTPASGCIIPIIRSETRVYQIG